MSVQRKTDVFFLEDVGESEKSVASYETRTGVGRADDLRKKLETTPVPELNIGKRLLSTVRVIHPRGRTLFLDRHEERGCG